MVKLESLRGEMANFAQDVVTERERRRAANFQALAKAGEEVVMMEHQIAAEARRRTEADVALKEYMQSTLDVAAAALDAAVTQRLDVITSNLTLGEQKVAKLEQALLAQRSKDEKLLADLRALTTQLTTKLRDEIEVERGERVRYENELITAMRQESERFAERIHLETLTREKTKIGLVDGVRRLSQWSERAADDSKRAALVAAVADLKERIVEEHNERLASEKNLEDLMSDLVRQVDVTVRASRQGRASRAARR